MSAQECTTNQNPGQKVDPTLDSNSTHKFPLQYGSCDRQKAHTCRMCGALVGMAGRKVEEHLSSRHHLTAQQYYLKFIVSGEAPAPPKRSSSQTVSSTVSPPFSPTPAPPKKASPPPVAAQSAPVSSAPSKSPPKTTVPTLSMAPALALAPSKAVTVSVPLSASAPPIVTAIPAALSPTPVLFTAKPPPLAAVMQIVQPKPAPMLVAASTTAGVHFVHSNLVQVVSPAVQMVQPKPMVPMIVIPTTVVQPASQVVVEKSEPAPLPAPVTTDQSTLSQPVPESKQQPVSNGPKSPVQSRPDSSASSGSDAPRLTLVDQTKLVLSEATVSQSNVENRPEVKPPELVDATPVQSTPSTAQAKLNGVSSKAPEQSALPISVAKSEPEPVQNDINSLAKAETKPLTDKTPSPPSLAQSRPVRTAAANAASAKKPAAEAKSDTALKKPAAEAKSDTALKKPAANTSNAVKRLAPDTGAAVKKPAPDTEVAVKKPTPDTEAAVKKPSPNTEAVVKKPSPDSEAAVEKPSPNTEAPVKKPSPNTEVAVKKPSPNTGAAVKKQATKPATDAAATIKKEAPETPGQARATGQPKRMSARGGSGSTTPVQVKKEVVKSKAAAPKTPTVTNGKPTARSRTPSSKGAKVEQASKAVKPDPDSIIQTVTYRVTFFFSLLYNYI